MQYPISKRVAFLGLFVSFSLVLSYIENLIPVSFAIPGIKIGLSNLAVLLCLYLFAPLDALIITLIKAIVSSFLFGNMTMLIYSISGAFISCLCMILVKQILKIHMITISAIGGIMHNVAQLGVAYFIIKSKGIFYYFPYLFLSGLLFGILIGFVALILLPYLKKIVKVGEKI